MQRKITILLFCWTIIFAHFLGFASNAQSQIKPQNAVTALTYFQEKEILRSSNPSISINLQGVSLEEALVKIAKKAKAGIYFDANLLPGGVVNIEFDKTPLSEVLKEVLNGTQLVVYTSGRNIFLKKMEGSSNLNKIDLKAENIQQETVSGHVFDAETGEALPGVNILIKSTTDRGTATNIDGEFELIVESLQDTLIFSYIGYERLEVPINERTAMEIDLVPQAITGDEIVVIGYGEQRRSDLTGSVSSVSADQFEGETISSLDQGLQGKAAGVNITSGSGRPGGEMIVRIRGSSSVLGGNEPLYVVDGVPVQSGTSGGTNMLAMLNPANIESIDILKDASATAIYGSRGSNGVIIITTKRGRRGSHAIDFQSSVGFSQVAKKIDMMNSQQFLEIANERAVNDGGSPIFSNSEIESLSEVNTDWQDKIFRTAPTQNYNLSFSGGSETTRYAISGNYYDEEGIIHASDFMRGSIRVNIDQEISSRLNLTTRSFLSRSITNAIPEENTIKSTLQSPPFMTVFDEDGNYTPASILKQYPFSPSTGENPVALIKEQLNRREMDRILGSATLDYDLLESLTLKVMLGLDYLGVEQDNYNPRVIDVGLPAGSGSKGMSRNTSFVNENTLNFQSQIRENDRINVTAGVTWQQDRSTYLNGASSGFVTDNLENNVLGSGENFSAPSNGFSEATLVSGLARINYVLDERFLFTISSRADGSSRFGEGNKWGFFPSGAFAWVLTEEEFIRQNLQQISELKLRVSYGVTGNQAIGLYQSMQRFSSTSLAFGGSPTTGFYPNNLGNPDLKWETTEEINFGMEIGLWNQRLRINTDYYVKNTSDLLAEVNIPPTSGFNTTFQNIGSTKNQGIEFDIDFAVIRSEVNWNIGLNVSHNQNTVTETAGGQDVIAPGVDVLGSMNIIREDEPFGAFYGLETDGLTEDGFFKYVDQNGDGEINDEDRLILGSPYPDLVYGFTTYFNYKNFDLKASIQGVIGKDMWNMNRYRYMSSMHRGETPIADVAENRWTPDNPNPDALYPRATSVLNQQPSDWFIEDASYLRLQNLQLTYHLPVRWTSSLGLRNASFNVSGQNLFTITDYSWYTPDVNTFASGDLRVGVDYQTYPSARTVTFGVRVGL